MIARWLQRIASIGRTPVVDWGDEAEWISLTQAPDIPGPVSTGPPPEV